MKFSSGERRGAILLLILTALLIGGMFLLRTDPPPQTLPAIVSEKEEIKADTMMAVGRDSCVVTPKENKSRRKKAEKTSRHPKKMCQRQSGRKRDYLDEPVGR